MILFVILVFTDIIMSCNVWKAYDSRKEKRIGKSRSLTKLLYLITAGDDDFCSPGTNSSSSPVKGKKDIFL